MSREGEVYGTTSISTQNPTLPQAGHGTAADSRSGVPARLDTASYHVAWICALFIELAAARAMLDDVHAESVSYEDDTNTYLLGSIKELYVVIACLPDAYYGTNNAAHVVTNMRRTFPAINQGLMVGIAGGAPTQGDIRLGDVVVGTRVMQYDLGRIISDGRIQPTGTPRLPQQSLGTLVSVIRSGHELRPSRIPSILEEKMSAHPKYCHPKLPDVLFQTNYAHASSSKPSCGECDEAMVNSRPKRDSDDPRIHYGAIASGNQVMKDAQSRDRIANQLGVMCFEMESAGLMDALPCLPIRGICDYSDSHKNKDWQRYAAACAAAYARELLETLTFMPPVLGKAKSRIDPGKVSTDTQDAKSKAVQERRGCLMKSLEFEHIHSRVHDIQSAHSRTCEWFLTSTQYLEWLDDNLLLRHHGFLWISGKPGAGKSTIMKYAYAGLKEHISDSGKSGDNHRIATFFFHARGETLQKSILGMYRSLLLQLLQGYPDLQSTLDNIDVDPERLEQTSSLYALKELFREAIMLLEKRSFTCFVDALDECDEQQVIEMIQYFEDLGEQSAKLGLRFRICFSTRHYPFLSIEPSIPLNLDNQAGHFQDLSEYVDSRLRVSDPALSRELKSQILNKAAGVFLWVVLVVSILNHEDRRGRPALRQRLSEIPSGLSELFKDIFTRDKEDRAELQLSLALILFSKRPLRPKELYHALWWDSASKGMADSKPPNLSAKDSINRFVTGSSKGFAEVTRSNPPTVQFIHESVRDFFLKRDGLKILWPDTRLDRASLCHDMIKECCHVYLGNQRVRTAVKRIGSNPGIEPRVRTTEEFPFLEYSSQHIHYHANCAANAIDQEKFLLSFPISDWVKVVNLFQHPEHRRYTASVSMLYILADRGLSNLIRAWRKHDSRINIPGECYGQPLFAALSSRKSGVVAALLGLKSDIYNGIDITRELGTTTDFTASKALTPLVWASQEGRTSLVEVLLQNETHDEKDISLLKAAQNGHESVARLLIKNGARVSVYDASGSSPLMLASQNGHWKVASTLISKGADVNAKNNSGSTPLLLASKAGHWEVASRLIEKKAFVNAYNTSGSTPLMLAAQNGHLDVATLLTEKGALVNRLDNSLSSALLLASENGHGKIVRLLLDKRASTNCTRTRGNSTYGPLTVALKGGYLEIARMLLQEELKEKLLFLYEAETVPPTGRTLRALIDEKSVLYIKSLNPLRIEDRKRHWWSSGLLVGKRLGVDCTDDNGWTALLRAASAGEVPITKILIKRGASLSARNNKGETALLLAAKKGHIEVVGLVLAEKDVDMDAKDNHGLTAAVWAHYRGHDSTSELLSQRGAKYCVKQGSGHIESQCPLCINMQSKMKSML